MTIHGRGPGMALKGRFDLFNRGRPDDRFRRILVIARRPGKGPLTEPTAAVQPRRRELVFMLVRDLGSPRRRELSAKSRRSAGQELCGAFWPGIRAGYWGRSSVTANHGALSMINACASGRTPGSSSSVVSRHQLPDVEMLDAAPIFRVLTPVVAPDASNFRNAEQRELYLSGLRLAMGEGQ
jgi:hypothetical protein